ncbi:hypothetical protein CACET_c22870 [Clostridium aceticum]|uniref:Uncharacterized protein n=1 Tax=Clostridium aceticum TaxID=84022 RepID=A0A0D8IBX1_9CLOT|nr:hypothetical protein [Clostridium aceticum]AKL95733.1 hypothetical protein CACET_c22870 [Clostridium aceticum]KJF26716.1 hypothetical protein TZ02_10830 [Clostridium aceticum]
MSLFQFLASDILLKEVKNPYIEFISINEALKRDIKLSDFIINDTKLDRDKKSILICDKEEHLDEMEINHDMYYSSEYAKEYSSKQYFSELKWRYTELRAKKLIDYLKEQLQISDEIEIWSIWLGEHKSANVESININELNIADLEFLHDHETPKCLVIKK